MVRENIRKVYREWLAGCSDVGLKEELLRMATNEKAMEDAFYRELAFGTGGLRGILGAGTNRMNCYTVAKATQGLAAYLGSRGGQSVAISYDSRHQSERFARVTACVLAACGINAWLYPRLMPTPCLSFAVRRLGCDAGVMITASHNPAEYNGYKVYGADGCQITMAAAEEIQQEINRIDPFRDVQMMEWKEGKAAGLIREIPDSMIDAYLEQVKHQSVWKTGTGSRLRIVYTPLHGSGLEPVKRVLTECGYTNLFMVEEQCEPDGAFPTCPYPNPEMPQALALGIQKAHQIEADLVLATDPDCDRVGAAVRTEEGEYELISGNEMGLLLLEYLCKRRQEHQTMPAHPVFVKTIVTTELARRIAAAYGVETIDVLTGFKYIGEQIGLLEACGRKEDFLFGFEDSFGYLAGTYVRDKDGVLGSFLICEMCAWYQAQGSNLKQELSRIYTTYGYCQDTLHTYELRGSNGDRRMQQIMLQLREGGQLWENAILRDYGKGIDGLPPSDVLKWILPDNSTIVVRPSGTEPKLKLYLSVTAPDRTQAQEREKALLQKMESILLCR